MSEAEATLQVYEIMIGGLPHSVQLDKETAERWGLTATKAKQAAAPANKARSADGK